MQFFLRNRIERTSAATATDVCTFWLANIRNFCSSLLQKHCCLRGWLALQFCCDIIFWKYTQESKQIKFGKDLTCSNIFAFKNSELKWWQLSRQTCNKSQLQYRWLNCDLLKVLSWPLAVLPDSRWCFSTTKSTNFPYVHQISPKKDHARNYLNTEAIVLYAAISQRWLMLFVLEINLKHTPEFA